MSYYSYYSGESLYHIGQVFYNEKNYTVAFSLFERAAQKFEHPSSLYQTGYMYHEGLGVDVDFEQALKWYKKAEIKNCYEAQNKIGCLYYLGGKGLNIDYKEAMYWFEKAAEKGDPNGNLNLGEMYQCGHGVTINHEQALWFFSLAAKQHNRSAQYKVGCAHRHGLGVTKNIPLAHQWYSTCANNSYGLAQFQLGLDYMNGFGVTKNFQTAIEWFVKSQGLSKSKLCLGYMYEKGLRVERDEVKAKQYFDENEDAMLELGMIYFKMNEGKECSEQALYWFKKAAEKKNVQALAAIGSMYLIGMLEGGRDIEKAYDYLSQAAEIEQIPFIMSQLMSSQDGVVETENKANTMKWYYKTSSDDTSVLKECISGLSCLWYLYHKGIGVRQDFSKAREMYLDVLREIDSNDTDANMCLGLLYSQGLGVDQDLKKAMDYFEASAKKVNTYAYNNIGDAYRLGNGVEQDDVEALKWYTKGSKYNDGYSQLNIGKIYADRNPLSWYMKSFENGCKEAQAYIENAESKDRVNINPLLTVERDAREEAEKKLCELMTELARVDPSNEVLQKYTAVATLSPNTSTFVLVDDEEEETL